MVDRARNCGKPLTGDASGLKRMGVSVSAIADFRIVGETDGFLVVDKPAPLIVHPANGKVEPTLLGGLQSLLAYEVANGAVLSIVTRLDRETSGLVLVAKHREATRLLRRMLEEGRVRKEYLAIVHGWPDWDRISVNEPILRKGEVEPGEIWLRQCVHPDGKASLTNFEVLRRLETPWGRIAEIRCFPISGRTHQIRVHLEHAGYPLVGDKIYGTDGSAYLQFIQTGWSDDMEIRLVLPRHALHASGLGFEWEGEPVAWESALPADLAGIFQVSMGLRPGPRRG